MRELKPNGERVGVFFVSIDDGYVEWTYKLKLDANGVNSVGSIWQVLRKAYRVRDVKPVMRMLHKGSPEGTLRVW